MENNIQSSRGPPILRKSQYRSNRTVPPRKKYPSRYSKDFKHRGYCTIFMSVVIFLFFTNFLYLIHLHESNGFDGNGGNGKNGIDLHLFQHKSEASKFWSNNFISINKDHGAKNSASSVIHNSIGKNEGTSALIGAQRGTIDCDIDVNDLVYWNDPQGISDIQFVSPFADTSGYEKVKYVTFEPDRGGWNNIRMSMEIVFVFAAATGRTLVLPPEQPLYLLNKDFGKPRRSYADFFPLDSSALLKQVPIITAEEFIRRESGDNGRLPIKNDKERIISASKGCVNRGKEVNSCEEIYRHFSDVGFNMPVSGSKSCIIFDMDVYQGKEISETVKQHVDRFCGEERTPYYYTQTHEENLSIHFAAHQKETRIFNHFYSFMLFSDPVIDNHFKRFVRDFLHYRSSIFCAAGKVIQAIQKEGEQLGFKVDEKGAGAFSALHVRRGDFQFKKQRISAEEWWENTKEIWLPSEILYIATDEKDKKFFYPIKEHREIRFIDDYWKEVGLDSVDPNYVGMIETIVASRGRAFAGTWFSTFTAYINRMRGYHGMDMKNSWYGMADRKYEMQSWIYPHPVYVAREWPLAWEGIDGDEFFNEDKLSISNDHDKHEEKSLARGLSGLPFDQTPSLIGAKRAKIECDENVDALAYWNDPQGDRDAEFESPFADYEGESKYITFEPDSGGWNNIRMCLEIIFIFAAATGRTLVMPPEQPLYLLNKDKSKRRRGFADFFPLDKPEFRKHLKIISMEEFISREGGTNGRFPIPSDMKDGVLHSQVHCTKRAKAKDSCDHLNKYLRSTGLVPEISGNNNCLIFDEDAFNGRKMSPSSKDLVDKFCGKRTPALYYNELKDAPLIHFQASQREYRLLNHFYGFIHFTNSAIDNYYKRFVRDFLHYHDSIFCAAGKIVNAIQNESIARGFHLDDEGGGGYSAFHVRRGDLQYKQVKIPGDEWQENTKEVFLPKEILYIATDERDKSFFDPIAEHHDVKFLDDYWDFAGLGDLDPNYMGMIDTIVASRGRIFVGTYFSTFSGYINRMRGYQGMTMKNSYYGTLSRKTETHSWKQIEGNVFAKEWPAGWIGIDGDTWVSKDVF